MGTDINFNKSLGRTYGTRIGLPAFDPAAQAYFAATGITGELQKAAINDLVKGLKTDGIWSKMKAVYPFVTDNRNLLSYTEDFSNAFWTKNNVTITSNSITAPNGTLTADKINENSGTINPLVTNNTVTYTIGQTYTASVYYKAAERNYGFIDLYLNNTDNAILVDLTNGTIVNTLGTLVSSSVESVGNGWYRLSVTVLNSSGSGPALSYGCKNSTNWGSYTGTAGYGIYIWGAQVELGSTATTYQPIATTQQAYIASQFKYNLVNPVDSDAAFRLVFNGGWTHSSNGATPNGTNGYADTNFNPVTESLNVNSNHMSVYLRTGNIGGQYVDIGQQDNYWLIAPRWASNISYVYNPNNSYTITEASTNSNNLSINTRRSLNNFAYFNNNNKIATNLLFNSSSFYNGNVFLASSGGTAWYSLRQQAFATIGDGLTDTEAAALYNSVNNFQVALSRNV